MEYVDYEIFNLLLLYVTIKTCRPKDRFWELIKLYFLDKAKSLFNQLFLLIFIKAIGMMAELLTKNQI